VPDGLDPVSYKDFPLVVVGMKGSELWKGLEMSLGYLGVTRAFFLEVSGVKYVYNSTNPVGSRLVELTVNGEPIDPNATYTVSANYIVAAIAQQFMKLQFESYSMAGLTEYDALRDFVKHKKVLWKESEGRIIDEAVQP